MSARPAPARGVVYPDSDGEQIADNTLQFDWITDIYANLARLFRDDPAVFVAGNNLIYPVEGDPKARLAPDVYVALGRPKGRRGSYKVWEEGGVFPQVVWEVLSPGNTRREMARKRDAYERYGAREYFVIDPDRVTAEVWVRRGDALVPAPADGFVSPLLGVRLSRGPDDWRLAFPDGSPFETLAETADRAGAERRRADAERAKADAERAKADAERAKADAAQAARIGAEADAARLRAMLEAAGLDPDARS